ncbi:MAG: hypothetical protein IT381_13780 [Deltaproteobacteria bacterium]|nr:hypothetical protein [Deltaproteobacteria bacterium]
MDEGSLNSAQGGKLTKGLASALMSPETRGLTLAKASGLSDHELLATYASACQLLKKNDFVGAAKIFVLLVALDHRQAKHWRGLGVCAQRAQRFKTAEFFFSAALERDPKDIISRVFRAEARLYLKKVTAAESDLKDVIDHAKQDKRVEIAPYVKRAQNLQQMLHASDQAAALEGGS